ncbi:MAG: ankyrin repeat protein [Pirellulaceae bacterium]|jgi:ankyrin repeat protein
MNDFTNSIIRLIVCLLVLSCSAVTVCAERPLAPLADAVEDKDWTRFSALLAEKADPNQAQVDGTTALHWAVYHDNVAAVKQLLEMKANPLATNRYDVAPLSLASGNGNAEMIQLLLAAGADVNTSLSFGETALMTASRTGRVDAVKLLLKHGASVKATELNKGQSAIMWAAAEGHVQVVDELIRAGADFRRPLKSGFTPFFFAVRGGHTKVVQRLLEAGIDVNDTLTTDMTGGKRPRNDMSPLILALENGHFELGVKLLEAGADPNDQRSGYTPLHAITWTRKPNRGDGPDGDPPPAGSGDVTSLQFVRHLVKHGANVNTRLKRGSSGRARLNQTGATPFLMAAKTADVPLLKLLLELGADASITNVDNCTPLMAAAGIGTIAPTEEAGTEEEALETIALLLKLGADVDAVDKNGETAMHGAAYKSLPKVAWLLHEKGADLRVWNKKNKYGWTPLLIAEGHRQGNFKPSFETIDALHGIMRSNGITPPPPTPREQRKGYDQD